MTAKRTLLEDKTYYDLDSKVTFKLLFSFTVDYKCTSDYKYGQLIKEFTDNELNGSTQKKSTIWWDGIKYTLDLNGSRTEEKSPINYSVAAIFHIEPKDGQKIYSPQFGKYLTLTKIEDHAYEMISPDGKNEYYYTNGTCTEVKLFRDFARFSFVMTPESLMAVKQRKVGGSKAVD